MFAVLAAIQQDDYQMVVQTFPGQPPGLGIISSRPIDQGCRMSGLILLEVAIPEAAHGMISDLSISKHEGIRYLALGPGRLVNVSRL